VDPETRISFLFATLRRWPICRPKLYGREGSGRGRRGGREESREGARTPSITNFWLRHWPRHHRDNYGRNWRDLRRIAAMQTNTGDLEWDTYRYTLYNLVESFHYDCLSTVQLISYPSYLVHRRQETPRQHRRAAVETSPSSRYKSSRWSSATSSVQLLYHHQSSVTTTTAHQWIQH